MLVLQCVKKQIKITTICYKIYHPDFSGLVQAKHQVWTMWALPSTQRNNESETDNLLILYHCYDLSYRNCVHNRGLNYHSFIEMK